MVKWTNPTAGLVTAAVLLFCATYAAAGIVAVRGGGAEGWSRAGGVGAEAEKKAEPWPAFAARNVPPAALGLIMFCVGMPVMVFLLVAAQRSGESQRKVPRVLKDPTMWAGGAVGTDEQDAPVGAAARVAEDVSFQTEILALNAAVQEVERSARSEDHTSLHRLKEARAMHDVVRRLAEKVGQQGSRISRGRNR